MVVNKDYSIIMREGKRILQRNVLETEGTPRGLHWGQLAVSTAIFIIIVYLLLLPGCAQAYTLDQYADAIRHAEGNSNYGILKHYKHTSYRQACKNTVWHSWTRYKKYNRNSPLKTLSAKDFTAYLGKTYCPIGALNDPMGLNRNWVNNVNYWLERGA